MKRKLRHRMRRDIAPILDGKVISCKTAVAVFFCVWVSTSVIVLYSIRHYASYKRAPRFNTELPPVGGTLADYEAKLAQYTKNFERSKSSNRSPTPDPSPIPRSPIPSSYTHRIVQPCSTGETFLTLFTTPRDGDALKMKIQLQTIKALQLLEPLGVRVMVFDFPDKSAKKENPRDSYSTWERHGTLHNFTVVSGLPTNQFGTPFLRPMFEFVEQKYPSTWVGYLNADILFSKDIVTALKAIQAKIDEQMLKKRVLVVGRRTNVDFTKDKTEFPKTPEDYYSWAATKKRSGRLFMQWAMDYFLMKPGTFNWTAMPDFVIGRPWYDMLIAHKATSDSEIDSIDASQAITAIHQSGTDGNFAGQKRRIDSDWNLIWTSYIKGADPGRGKDAYLGDTNQCNWQLKAPQGAGPGLQEDGINFHKRPSPKAWTPPRIRGQYVKLPSASIAPQAQPPPQPPDLP